MKSTGIVRKIDELGRIVVPIELRRTLGIGERESLEIFVDGDNIVLRKYVASIACILCGEVPEDKAFEQHTNGKIICHNCLCRWGYRY